MDPIVLWSCFRFGSGKIIGDDIPKYMSLWRQRESLLKENGATLKLLVPKKGLRRKGVFEVIDRFEQESPELLIDSPGMRTAGDQKAYEIYDYRLEWPRDGFQFFNNLLCVNFSTRTYTPALLQNMGITHNQVVSRIGEGGLSVKTDTIAIVSDLEAITEKDLQLLQSQGYTTYKMPVLMTYSTDMTEAQRKLFSRMKNNGHMDTELNCAKTPYGNLILTVNNHYYAVFRNEVEALRKTLDAKLYVIEHQNEVNGQAVNFLQLPNGAILSSENYPELNKFLTKNVGRKLVYPIETFDTEYGIMDGSGGMRCRTNIIYLLHISPI